MKQIKFYISLFSILSICFVSEHSMAQVAGRENNNDKKTIRIRLGSDGLRIENKNKKRNHHRLHTGAHIDLGWNNVVDNTGYQISQSLFSANNSINNGTALLTENKLSLKNGRSINVNLWPVWFNYDLAGHGLQLESGLGFQFFNYQYHSNIVHTDMPSASFATTEFENNIPFFKEMNPANFPGEKMKNKLGISYISLPLMLRFNSPKKHHPFFIGAGVVGSYKLKSWTKYYGTRTNGNFGINQWMTQVMAEIGIKGVIKLYGTYALESMYASFIERQPFAIGIRL